MTPDAELLTPREVGRLRGVTRQTVYLWLRAGLPSVAGARGILVRREDAERWPAPPAGWKKGRARKAKKKLTAAQLARARALLGDKPTLAKVAAELGVMPAALWAQLHENNVEKT